MKKNNLIIYSVFIVFLSVVYDSAYGQDKSSNTPLSIIPLPQKITQSIGSFIITEKTPIHLIGFNKNTNQLSSFASKFLKSYGNFTKKPKGKLLLEINKNSYPTKESYHLTINSSGIKIESNSEQGIFAGIQTLIQLTSSENRNEGILPFLKIEDSPRYSYRGVHLDVARHMFPVSFIKEYIDLLALYKFNNFHWHLTDDQGWRIEIKKYSKLTSIGGFRAQTLIGHLKTIPHQYDQTPYGGFYTQNEIKEIVAYASSKYINVIPEIELPGHSIAALAAYPELSCGDGNRNFKVGEKWGVYHDIYCAGKDSTFEFLEDVLAEVLDLFPSPYIHIGGDEAPNTKWKICAYCQKRIKDENLKNEHELQSYFIQRIEKYLNGKGRKIIGWDEILEGGLAPNATVMSWRGTKGGIAAAKQNHDVIMTPSSHMYFDHNPSQSVEEPLTNGKLLPLEKVYSFEPTPSELDENQQKRIIGVQANVWTEHMKTPNKVLYMLLPRLLAISEVAWTQPMNKNWIDFSENRVPAHLAKFDYARINYRVPEPIGIKDTSLIESSYTLNLKSPVKGAHIYYTIDGHIPYDFDYQYKHPVTIQVPSGEERTIKTVVITATGKRSVVVTTKLKNPFETK